MTIEHVYEIHLCGEGWQTEKNKQEPGLLLLPPEFASILETWGTPALLETVAPQETLCAVNLSAKYQRLQAPDTRQMLELTVFLVCLTGLVGLTSP